MKRLTIILSVLVLTVSATAGLQIPNDTDDVTVYFYAYDKATGAPNDAPVITNLDLYYVEKGAAASAKADATALAAANSAHDPNKAYNVVANCVRVDWPDSAFDGGGGKTVELLVIDGAGDDVYAPVTVQLGADVYTIRGAAPYDDESLAAAIDDHSADANAILAYLAHGTYGLPAIENLVDDIGAAGAGLTAVPWNPNWDPEVESEANDALVALHLDRLFGVAYDPASKPGVADALLNELIGNDGGVSQFTQNALELAPSGTVDPNDFYAIWTIPWIASGVLDPNFPWTTMGGLLKQAALKE